jgi:hypothetical protein
MDLGAVISYSLLFVAILLFVFSVISALNITVLVVTKTILHKTRPAYSYNILVWSLAVSAFYIILFCTGHVKF